MSALGRSTTRVRSSRASRARLSPFPPLRTPATQTTPGLTGCNIWLNWTGSDVDSRDLLAPRILCRPEAVSHACKLSFVIFYTHFHVR